MPRRIPGQPGLLRELNDRNTLELLLDEGPKARTDIAVQTGLSKPTAAQAMKRLEAAGLIVGAGTEAGKRGPNAILYAANTANTLGVAIDIQTDAVESQVVSPGRKQFPPVVHKMSADERQSPAADIITGAISRAVAAAEEHVEAIQLVCVGARASFDETADRVLLAAADVKWPREQVAKTLTKSCGVRVLLENDTNLAAVAERVEGAGRGLDSFALVWLGEGIGVGLDVHGALHRGGRGSAGEIAYLEAPSRVKARDPHVAKLGDSLADSGLIRLAIEREILSPGAGLESWSKLIETIRELDDEHPFMVELAERLALVLNPVIAVADPQRVILQGPVALAGGRSLAIATERALENLTEWSTEVLPPMVTRSAVLSGARDFLHGRLRDLLYSHIEGTLNENPLAEPEID